MKRRLWAAFVLLAPVVTAQTTLADKLTHESALTEMPMRVPMLLTDQDGSPMTGKERQKACTDEWRRFSAAEKTAQGPSWPQFYSRCIKRLKAKAG